VFEISQQEASMTLLAEYIMEGSISGTSPMRQGNSNRDYAPQGCYRSKESVWVAISVETDDQWRSFCHSLGLEDLFAKKDYATKDSRRRNAIQLDSEITECISGYMSEDIAKKLQDALVPCERILTLLEAAENKDFHEMKLFEEISHPESGNFDYPVPPWDFETTPVQSSDHPLRSLNTSSECWPSMGAGPGD
jgi:crotonobetainyl-CoA:carnitine CoA-transferase CaiB-like acyl-CoA transferase